ncbi:long chain fatty acid-CoA synthetase Faa4p [Mycolicibacterium sp. 120270]|uniref:long chain fatty acid-CoA synthetase Faa4p n=1 Tax=Mycolicibacterium sp. 120270 TaxID=3090600 RepID=UPI00299E41C7|nr:long chain fatty acid-CoA synthetase Faa4p [Mycolicibacterium sp. 120270]MDX1887096.1 long chain fatty acid-CoA synthetase Faa4p [Mycolicibacterium sp. 120270]
MATLSMVRTRRQSGVRRAPRINFGQCFGIEIERESDGWLIRIPEIGGETYARRREAIEVVARECIAARTGIPNGYIGVIATEIS